MSVVLAFVTAVSRNRAEHLAETAASVAETTALLAQAGHECRWYVSIDGIGAEKFPCLNAADVVITLDAQLGVSAARNAAAAHVPLGAWVLPLDGDDVLVPGGVAELAGVLSCTPAHVAWVATNRLEHDGRTPRSWFDDLLNYEPGELNAQYQHPHLFHPNNVAYRASALFEAGGWPATPGGEDLALTLRIARTHAGIAHPAVTVRYRRWERQSTMDSSFRALRPVRHALYQRFDLLNGRDGNTLRSQE
jgi:hypothetical protein